MKAEEYIRETVMNAVIFKSDAEKAVELAKREIREEYEQKYKHVEDLLEGIIEDCDHLTSGNVSHNVAGIKGAALRRLEYIRKYTIE